MADSLRRFWDGLNERERRLVSLLGAVFAGLVLFGVVYGATASVATIEEENARIEDVLREIGNARARLAQREAEREAAVRRYATRAPALGSFVEAQAGQQSPALTVREVVDQPEKAEGNYTRRGVRVSLPGVGLRPTIKLMESVANSAYPVAIERIQIEHFQQGDVYNVQMGVLAYDRAAPRRSPTKSGQETNSNGPPPPP